MREVIEPVVVAAVVAGCAIFSVWRLLSIRFRLRVLDALLAVSGPFGGKLFAGLRRRTFERLAGGCGACSRGSGAVNATFPPANRTPGAPPR